MASGRPMRPQGMSVSRAARASGVSQAARLIGVWMAPGAMELTRMRWGASSWAKDCIQVQVRDGVSEARLRLSPEHLGEVTVRLRVESGGVTAILHAESPQVSGWIAAHQDELRS